MKGFESSPPDFSTGTFTCSRGLLGSSHPFRRKGERGVTKNTHWERGGGRVGGSPAHQRHSAGLGGLQRPGLESEDNVISTPHVVA